MPINIFDETKKESVDWICDDDWEMPCQIEALENWLFENGSKLQHGKYTADIGYSPRQGACGGGCILSIKAMKILVDIGMELALSEYPTFGDDEEE